MESYVNMFFLYSPFFLKILLILLSLGGFLLARRIHIHKKKKKPLVCPMKSNCDAVVHSNFSKLFGINLEVLGMIYYGFVFFVYTVLLFFPVLGFADSIFALAIISSIAVIFSVYLVSLQAFVIKQWCAWCLGSAFVSLFIAIFSWMHADLSFYLMLYKWKVVLVIAHAMFAAVGVGATTVTDVLFFKFLRDYRISTSEVDIMNTLSKVLWICIFSLIATGIGFVYLGYPEIFENTKFVAKTIIVGIIALNGVLLNLVISPKLLHISFGEPHHHLPGELHRIRRLAFASGAVSIVSWYSAFLLGSVRSLPLSVFGIFAIYIVVVLFAVAGSQFFEKKFSMREI